MKKIKTTRYESNLQPLIAWLKIPSRPDRPPEPFLTWAKKHQPEEHIYVKFWPSIIIADEDTFDDDWLQGFPHIHKNTMGWDGSIITMMLYLQKPESGGEIGIGGYDENDPYTFLKPEPGLAVFVDANRWHGVKPVLSGERLAIIVTGFPCEYSADRKNND